jgi:diacylglycerol kinase family enzyme
VLRASIDVVEVIAGDESVWCASHVVARRSWWRGEVVLAMNAQFLGDRDIAPRSHPNDGKVDVLRVDPAMSRRSRRQAATRARNGSHLPHPQLSMRSASELSLAFERPLVVWVDGVRWASRSAIDLRVHPDALFVCA